MVAEGTLDFCLCDEHLQRMVLRISPVAVPGECPRHECLARLRCPAEATPDGAGLLLADRCTHCALAFSVWGARYLPCR